MIHEFLNQQGIVIPSKKLPELTHDELESALQRERIRRSKRYNVPLDAIVLSDEAEEKIILRERENKLNAEAERQYWAMVDAEPELLQFTPAELWKHALLNASRIIGRRYIVDDFNRTILIKLCMYFSNNPKAIDYGMDLDKGILLMGGVGTGKTTIMKAFQQNQLQSFNIKSARFISYDFSEQGFQIVKMYSRIESSARNAFGQTALGLCIDDLGTDEERKHFGDKVNALTEIILNRYDSLPHRFTHVTTNLNADAIEKIYGLRVRSRMREMFNVLSFDTTTPDRRK